MAARISIPNSCASRSISQPAFASFIGSVGPLGAILGGLTFGTLSQRIGRRRAITIGSVLVLPMIYFWVFFTTDPGLLAVTAFTLHSRSRAPGASCRRI